MGTGDIPTGKSSIQLGAGDIVTGKSGIGREEKDEEDGEKQELRRNPAREGRIPARYWANLAIEGSNPRGSGEHPEPQTYEEA
ncbi:unnamed protein product, partial [Sphagnum tenellum]